MGLQLAQGCSPGEADPITATNSSGDASTTDGSANGSGGTIGNLFFGEASTGVGPTVVPLDGTCGEGAAPLTLRPLDIFFLVDVSGSMDDDNDPTRWESVTEAIKEFVTDEAAANPEEAITMGLTFFPIRIDSAPDNCSNSGGECGSDWGTCLNRFGNACRPIQSNRCWCTDADSCEVNAYAQVSQPFVDLTSGTASAEIIALLDRTDPGGSTPTRPALEGAVKYVRENANPEHQAVIVLATDGDPQGCDSNDIDNVANIASSSAGANPSVPVFVIGLGEVDDLHTVALAGGTGSAVILTGDNVKQEFADAIIEIRSSSVSCDYNIPEPDDDGGAMKPDKAFATLLRDGPSVGVHAVTWCDTLANLERTVERQLMREFEHRVLFQMSATDSTALIDVPAASRLGPNRALVFTEETGVIEKFRPYGFPEALPGLEPAP